jgi:transcriptional regulator with XRE-family HTH domain
MARPRKNRKVCSLIGEKLFSLRAKQGLNLGALASAVGVSVGLLSEIENGHAAMSNDLAEKIADFFELRDLDRLEFFRAADQTRPSTLIEAENTIGRLIIGQIGRNINKMSIDDLERLQKVVREYAKYLEAHGAGISPDLCSELIKLHVDVANSTRVELERFSDFQVGARSAKKIQEAANRFRELLGLDMDAGPNMVHLVEFVIPTVFEFFQCQIYPRSDDAWQPYAESLVFRLDKTGKRVGRLLRIREDIYEGARLNDPRCVWILAHELGHLVLCHYRKAEPLSRSTLNTLKRLPPYRLAEWQAREFAAAFLAPEAACLNLSPLEISAKFHLSRTNAEKRKEVVLSRVKSGHALRLH